MTASLGSLISGPICNALVIFAVVASFHLVRIFIGIITSAWRIAWR